MNKPTFEDGYKEAKEIAQGCGHSHPTLKFWQVRTLTTYLEQERMVLDYRWNSWIEGFEKYIEELKEEGYDEK